MNLRDLALWNGTVTFLTPVYLPFWTCALRMCSKCSIDLTKKSASLHRGSKKREKRYYLIGVSNTNGDFLHKFPHKVTQECYTKNTELLGKK